MPESGVATLKDGVMAARALKKAVMQSVVAYKMRQKMKNWDAVCCRLACTEVR